MLFVGTSGWAYKAWKPAFYPEKLAQAKFLQHYSTRLNAVEVNASFRRLLRENVMQKWAQDTTPGFRFSIKAHQMITHFRRLKDVADFTHSFTSTLQSLVEAGKLGPVLFQLPPDFKADIQRLEDFLALLPRALPAAFEFRHDSWFADPVYASLEKHGAALCIAETEEYAVPDVVTAPFSYYRLRKPDYSPADVAQISARVHQAAADRDVFVFFKHEERPDSALNAERVLHPAQAKSA